MLALMLKAKGVERLRCFAFATPNCADFHIAESCEEYVTSVVFRDDIVSRFSPEALANLHRQLRDFNKDKALQEVALLTRPNPCTQCTVHIYLFSKTILKVLAAQIGHKLRIMQHELCRQSRGMKCCCGLCLSWAAALPGPKTKTQQPEKLMPTGREIRMMTQLASRQIPTGPTFQAVLSTSTGKYPSPHADNMQYSEILISHVACCTPAVVSQHSAHYRCAFLLSCLCLHLYHFLDQLAQAWTCASVESLKHLIYT